MTRAVPWVAAFMEQRFTSSVVTAIFHERLLVPVRETLRALYPLRALMPVALLLLVGGCAPSSGPEAASQSKPARITMHRLNRVEYNNTVHDLLGTSLAPADLFPSDDMSHGFDNIGDVLSMSPVQVEMYHHAAEALINDAMSADRGATRRIEAEDLDSTVGAATGDAWKLVTNGELATTLDSVAGTYRVEVVAWGERIGPVPIRMAIRVAGADVALFDVLADATKPGAYEATIKLHNAPLKLEVAYLNDRDTNSKYRNLLIDSITLEGPIGIAASNPMRERIMICDPAIDGDKACAGQIIGAFGQRAWRRPLTQPEIAELVELALPDDPAEFESGIALALRAILASPSFVFRIEADPISDASTSLDGYALASRLSYFLWSSMPDDELFAAAAAGSLAAQDTLQEQIERMLNSSKAAALVDNFVGQWLSLRGLDAHEPDSEVFPSYDLALKNDMVVETKTLFRSLLADNRPVHELLTANFTFANSRLAAHYDLAADLPRGDRPDSFTRVPLSAERAGLLGQASILTVTSQPTRTSPVKRGKWVLEQLLCTTPPPPPPGVAGLTREKTPSASLRERMEVHRSEPMCSACHNIMDPIGFGLENFDGTGKFRTLEGDFAIDASGTLPGGEAFQGSVELSALLAKDPRFPRCVVTQMYTYALGRAPVWDVGPFTSDWVGRGAGLSDLVTAIAASQPFRQHRAMKREAR